MWLGIDVNEPEGALYVDTSAIGRVLLGEPDADAVIAALSRFDQHVASRMLSSELRRLARREDRLTEADQLLGGIALIPVTDTILEAAEAVEPEVIAPLDAIHLVTALQLSEAGILKSVMTYDKQLATGAQTHGLSVIAPS